MDIRFAPAPFETVKPVLARHWSGLPGRVDAFFEEHLAESDHYRVLIDGVGAGWVSARDNALITGFIAEGAGRRHGQAIWRALIHHGEIREALVPTADEWFLAHALDHARQIKPQAHQFRWHGSPTPDATRVTANARLVPLRADESARLRELTGDFFEPVDVRIGRGELFATEIDGEIRGYGLYERSWLYDAGASVGMLTLEEHRGRGVGSTTIALLIEHCLARGWQPAAGCWFYNHASKRTLERAGLTADGRLLRVEY